MNENEPVNESQSQAAGGSGDSPEKRVADYVEDLCRHIADNGFDLLADVAVESLVANGAVPSGAYLHSVKTSWCLHRAAVHYARQYGVERAAADRARGDAQFEHSHRVQAERKAEKLEAELAQSVLLVENQRLRMEEMEQQQREVRQQMLETAEAALLEQQQRNEDLQTRCSQQRMEIAELQAQVKFLKDREVTLGARLQEEKAVTAKRLDQIQELRSEVSHVQRLWGESRRRVEELETLVNEKQEPAIPAGGGLLRDVSHYTEMAETDTLDADVSAEQQIRTLQEIIDAQVETIARLHSEVSALNTKVCELERMQKDDRIADSGTLDAGTAEPQPADYTPPEGWRLLQVGEVIEAGDEHVSKVDNARSQRVPIGDVVPQYVRYIRRIEPEPGSEQIAS